MIKCTYKDALQLYLLVLNKGIEEIKSENNKSKRAKRKRK